MKTSRVSRHHPENGGSRRSITRRRFIKDLSVGAAGVALAGVLPVLDRAQAGRTEDLSKVVIARHPNSVIDAYTFDQSIVGELVNRAITEFTGEEAPGLAWAQIFPELTASSCISIKVNCNNSACSSHQAVAQAIVEGLASMQVGGGSFARNKIIIWESSDGKLSSAGYTTYTGSDPDTVRCSGVTGYDSDDPLNINGYTCYPSSTIAEDSDYLINLAVLKNHTGPGVTLCMKNHLDPSNNPSGLPHGGMDPELSDLHQEIKDELGNKHRISIIDSLVGIKSGGLGGSPQFIYGGIILGTDRVAVDYVGREVLADNGRQIPSDAGYIDTSGAPPHALGTANLAEMDIVEHNPIVAATKEYVDKMIRFHQEGLATSLQVLWAVNRYARGL